jgi:hypothetical protein
MDDKVMDQVRRHHSRHTTMPLQVVDPIAYAFSGMWGFIDARCTVHDTCFADTLCCLSAYLAARFLPRAFPS